MAMLSVDAAQDTRMLVVVTLVTESDPGVPGACKSWGGPTTAGGFGARGAAAGGVGGGTVVTTGVAAEGVPAATGVAAGVAGAGVVAGRVAAEVTAGAVASLGGQGAVLETIDRRPERFPALSYEVTPSVYARSHVRPAAT